jgi:hypothetical protein
MKRSLVVFCLVLLIGGVSVSWGLAQAGLDASADLPRWTIDGGGDVASGGGFMLAGTIGQPEAATWTGATYTLQGGFWGTGQPFEKRYPIFLPIVLRENP